MKFLNRLKFLILLCTLFHTSFAGKLTVWIAPNSEKPLSNFRESITDFTRRNPHIKVDVKLFQWSELWYALNNIDAKMKDKPDLVQLGTTWVPYFEEKGILLNIKRHMALFGGKRSFLKPTWNTMYSYGSRDIVSLPWFIDTKVLMINKKYFDQLNFGTKDFSTWSDFYKSLKRIKKSSLQTAGKEVFPLGMTGKGDLNVLYNLAPWIWSSGGSFLKFKNGKWYSNLNSSKTQRGIDFYLRLVRSDFVRKDELKFNSNHIQSLFAQGKHFMMFNGSFRALTSYKNDGLSRDQLDDDGIIVLPFPKGPHSTSNFLGGSNLSICKFSENKKQALQLMQYLLNNRVVVNYANTIGALPGKKVPLEKFPKENQENVRSLLSTIQDGRSFPNISLWGYIEDILKEEIEKLLYMTGEYYGSYSQQEVMDHIKQTHHKINGILGVQEKFKVFDPPTQEDPDTALTENNSEPVSPGLNFWDLIQSKAIVFLFFAVFFFVGIFLLKRK